MSTDHNLPAALDAAGQLVDPRTAEARVKGKFWPKFWKVLGRIPFSEEIAAAWYCARDPNTPARAKAVLYLALAYFVLPADLLPDIIAAVGFTDDATVLAAAIGIVGAHVKDAHRAAAHELLRKGP